MMFILVEGCVRDVDSFVLKVIGCWFVIIKLKIKIYKGNNGFFKK